MRRFGPVTIGEQSSVTISCADGPLSPTVTLPPIADAWVDVGTTEATVNPGSETQLFVRDATNGGRREVLLQFDISSVPSVASANLGNVGQSVRPARGAIHGVGHPRCHLDRIGRQLQQPPVRTAGEGRK